MIKLRALKSFLGQSGESEHPDGMVRRGAIFKVASPQRAADLRRRGLVEDACEVRHTAKGWPKPAADEEAAPGGAEAPAEKKPRRRNKKKEDPENKDAPGGAEAPAEKKPRRRNKKKEDPENKDAPGPLDDRPAPHDGIQTGADVPPSSSQAEAAPGPCAENSGGLLQADPPSAS